MALTVYKYPFPITDRFSLDLPVGAKPLYVGLDPLQQSCLWALIDPQQTMSGHRHFWLAGTGHPIRESIIGHVGSFVQGPYVWHVFEVR